MREVRGRNGGTLKVPEKGETNNPKGRPPKLPDIKLIVAEVLESGKGDKTAAYEIAKKWAELAKAGDLKAGEILFAYAYGRPTQRSEISGPDGKKIDLNLSTDEKKTLLTLIEKSGAVDDNIE